MVRNTVAHVDLDALRANFTAVREFLAAPGDQRTRGPEGPPVSFRINDSSGKAGPISVATNHDALVAG